MYQHKNTYSKYSAGFMVFSLLNVRVVGILSQFATAKTRLLDKYDSFHSDWLHYVLTFILMGFILLGYLFG